MKSRRVSVGVFPKWFVLDLEKFAKNRTKTGEPMNKPTGRTQRMIEEVCDMVESDGQRIIVMGHTMHFCADNLMPRIRQCLEGRGLKPERGGQYRLICGECRIDFLSIGNVHDRLEGYRGRVVWDHHALWMDRFGPWLPPKKPDRCFGPPNPRPQPVPRYFSESDEKE